MSFVPASICAGMKKKDKLSLTIHQESDFKLEREHLFAEYLLI